jgi:hypothetical protein
MLVAPFKWPSNLGTAIAQVLVSMQTTTPVLAARQTVPMLLEALEIGGNPPAEGCTKALFQGKQGCVSLTQRCVNRLQVIGWARLADFFALDLGSVAVVELI